MCKLANVFSYDIIYLSVKFWNKQSVYANIKQNCIIHLLYCRTRVFKSRFLRLYNFGCYCTCSVCLSFVIRHYSRSVNSNFPVESSYFYLNDIVMTEVTKHIMWAFNGRQ